MARLKNRRHEVFCREYVNRGFNGAAAARAAGSTEISARKTASDWLSKPDIVARIDELNEDLLDDLVMTKEEVIAEMNKMASFNMADVYDDDGRMLKVHEMPRDEAAAIKEIGPNGIKVDKRAALDSMMKHYNAFEDHQNAGKAEMNVYLDDKDAEA